MLAQVVERDELIWFGRPPDESQLGDHDEELAARVRVLQHDAYALLADIERAMQVALDRLVLLASSFGPASYQGGQSAYDNQLASFKDLARQHIEVEVTD